MYSIITKNMKAIQKLVNLLITLLSIYFWKAFKYLVAALRTTVIIVLVNLGESFH